jgi:hypothetical protein
MAHRVVLALAIGLLASLPASALTSWMNEGGLNQALSGKTIEGHYSDGATFTESYGGDGRLRYQDDKRETQGRWSIHAGSFCTIYDYDPSGGCYRVHKVSENCFEFYFAARTVEQAQGGASDKPSWTARGWVKGTASTCAENVGV